MRHCANVADQFAQMLTQSSFNGNQLMSPGVTHTGNKRLGTEEEDVEGATKKRRITNKKAKDPDAPKRAASSYIFFQNDLRQELRRQHPDISPAELMARVSKQWAEMTPEQKAVRLHSEIHPQFASNAAFSALRAPSSRG
jgi:HMG (high mobility group) box